MKRQDRGLSGLSEREFTKRESQELNLLEEELARRKRTLEYVLRESTLLPALIDGLEQRIAAIKKAKPA